LPQQFDAVHLTLDAAPAVVSGQPSPKSLSQVSRRIDRFVAGDSSGTCGLPRFMPPSINLLPRHLMALSHLRHTRPADPNRHDNLELVRVTPEAPPLQPKNFTTRRRPHIRHVVNDIVKHVS